jgi:hypothetical protein
MHEKEKEELVMRQEESYKRTRKLERQVEELKGEKVKLLEKISELDHLSKKLSDSNEKLTTHQEQELTTLTSRYETQVWHSKSFINGTDSRPEREIGKCIRSPFKDL